MTSLAQKIVDLHRAQPKMTAREVAAALSTTDDYVRAVSYRRRICFPSGIKPSLINVLVKALELIDDGGCERLTGGGYRCQAEPAWSPDAEFTNDRWCDSCIASAALTRARGETP